MNRCTGLENWCLDNSSAIIVKMEIMVGKESSAKANRTEQEDILKKSEVRKRA